MKNENPYDWTKIVGLNEKIFGKYQPERSKREDCEKGMHMKHGNYLDSSKEWKCDYCNAIITDAVL